MKRIATFVAIAALLAAPLAFAGETNTHTANKTTTSATTTSHTKMMTQHSKMNQSASSQMTPSGMMQKMTADSRDMDMQFMKMKKQFQSMMAVNDMTKLKTEMKQYNTMLASMQQRMMQHQRMQIKMESLVRQYSLKDPSSGTKK